MSKYVIKRREKIKILSEELNNINIKINGCIEALKNIQQKNDIFIINYSFISDIEEDLSIKYLSKEINLKFHDKNIYYICFPPAHYEKEMARKFQKIIDIIEENKDTSKLDSYIYKAEDLYSEIEKLYKEIKLKNGEFSQKADLIISAFKKMINKQNMTNNKDENYCYLKMRKNNKKEIIDLIFQKDNQGNESFYKIILPEQKNIDEIYNKKIQNDQYNKNLYIDIFKEEIIRLNDILFVFLNFDVKDIVFEKLDNYGNFYIRNIDEEAINIISEKIKTKTQLNNF